MQDFYQALNAFFQWLAQAEAVPGSAALAALPAELQNVDQLKVLLEALPDYPAEEVQPSYVLAIPCRPIVMGLSTLFPGLPCLSGVNWAALPLCPPASNAGDAACATAAATASSSLGLGTAGG